MLKNYFVLIILLSISLHMSTYGQIKKLTWELGYVSAINKVPDRWIPAEVPGAVQLDIAKDRKWGPYYYGENWKDYTALEPLYYIYRTNFIKPDIRYDEHLLFITKGIDYEFDIYLNNEKLFHQEGMFSWVKLDLTDKLKKSNELKVIVYPVPNKRIKSEEKRTTNILKTAVSYGWDFHPRLIPLGIWDETYLEIQAPSAVDDIWVNYQLNNKLDSASLFITAKGRNLTGNKYVWKLLNNENKEILILSGDIDSTEIMLNAEFPNPTLWWPHDQGVPYLYSSVFELKNSKGNLLQKVSQKVGFRRIKLVTNEGAWDEPAGYPKSRSNPPAQFEVNGRRIFVKGANWVNPEIFYGTITKERYNNLLTLAKDANFNILRIWGGGIINKESFYDLCDEKGILVWQDFPLAGNYPDDDPNFLKLLEHEAVSIILRLKKHASLALWCGGNELFNGWTRMTDQSYALRLLNSLTYKLDPQTPFNYTTPLSGMAHGHYVFREWKDPRKGEEVYTRMKRSHYTAYAEFGCPAPSSVEILKKIIPENELWPPKEGTSWESHHAFKEWVGNTWLMDDMLADYFGPAKNLEELIEEAQMIQGEGLKAIYEGARRQKPYCAMALNWCFNEPWYCAANNSIVSYPDSPKAGYYDVKNACRPFLASAEITKFKWMEGEDFSTKLWILNDLPVSSPGGTIIVKLVAENKSLEIFQWDYPSLLANTNKEGPLTIPVKLPSWDTERIKVVLEVEGKPEFNSEYTILYQPHK